MRVGNFKIEKFGDKLGIEAGRLPIPSSPEPAQEPFGFSQTGSVREDSPGLVSKLFQSVSQILGLNAESEAQKQLQERRRSMQELLLEIHPPENRIGRRPAPEVERDPFVQSLNQIDTEQREIIEKILQDNPQQTISLAELSSLYESPAIEIFFQKYEEVREEIFRKDPSYIRQKTLEESIEGIQGKDTIALIREDLEMALAEIELEEESARLADAEYTSDLGDGESDAPIATAVAEPSDAVQGARRKLAIFNGLIEELEFWETQSEQDLEENWEELEGIARDFSAYETEWVWNQLEAKLEAVQNLDSKHPKVQELRKAIARLESNTAATPQDYQIVLAKAEEAALWTSVEERIRLYSEMHESAGMTDGIIHLGKKAYQGAALILGGPLAYQAHSQNTESEIDGASAYLEMQTRYIAVHRALTEGKYSEARKRFVRLENSQEHTGLLDGYQDSQRINQCAVTAAIVTASAATAGIATELIGGAATALGMTRGLSLLKFGSNAAVFTLAEQSYTSLVYDKNFFDPKLSFSENIQDLGWGMAMNAGMFAFLGKAFRLFEKNLVLPLARNRALAKVGQVESLLNSELIQAEREILLNQVTTGIPLRLGRFGTELLAFGLWDAIAQNLELNRESFKEGKSLSLVFPTETLFSLQAWEERFVFLIALKAGGLLAAPITKPIHEGLHENGLAHGDPEFRNVFVQTGEIGEMFVGTMIGGKKVQLFPVETEIPSHAVWEVEDGSGNDSSLKGRRFHILPMVGGGHDGPQTPKSGDSAKFVEMFQNGEEAAAIRGLVELAEQGLPDAVADLVFLKLHPATVDRRELRKALSSLDIQRLVERAPEDYPALRALLELSAGENEAAQNALGVISLKSLRDSLAQAPQNNVEALNLLSALSDCLLYGSHEAEAILFGKYRHELHPENLANWEEKVLVDSRLNYSGLSLAQLVMLAREGRKDAVVGLLEMSNDRDRPGAKALLDKEFSAAAVSVIAERISLERGKLGPTKSLVDILWSLYPDDIRRLADAAPFRPDAQRALLEVANVGYPDALDALPDLPLYGYLENGQEVSLFSANHPALGLTAWKFVGLREGKLTFKKVRMHSAEREATLRLSGIEKPFVFLKPGKEYYFLEKNDADPMTASVDPSPFSLPFMILGPGTPLLRGLSWLWGKIWGIAESAKAKSPVIFEDDPAEGWALNEHGLHYFENPRMLHLTDRPSEFSEKKFGKWRAIGLQQRGGKSFIILEKQKPALEQGDPDASPEYLHFESTVPLRRIQKNDGRIYLIGEGISLSLDTDLYFYSGVSGGSGGSGFAFGRSLNGKAARGLIVKDFSGWKGRFQLYQIEERRRDEQGNEVLVLKGADPGGKSAKMQFQIEAGDGENAYASWQAGDYVYFIAEGSKGLMARPGAGTQHFNLIETYKNWLEQTSAAMRQRISKTLFGNAQKEIVHPRRGETSLGGIRLVEIGTNDYYLELNGTDREMILGRHADSFGSVFFAEDTKISRRHLRITQESSGVFRAENISSTNTVSFFQHGGNHIELKEGESATLADGNQLLLGDSRIRVSIPNRATKLTPPEGITIVSPPPAEELKSTHGEIVSRADAGEPAISQPQREYPLFQANAPEGHTVMLGRGKAPAGFDGEFISITDPVIHRRHLLLRRGSDGQVEVRAIPPSDHSADFTKRKAYWLEIDGNWFPLPPDVPYIMNPNQRFAIGPIFKSPQDTSQALIFSISPDGNSLILDSPRHSAGRPAE